MKLSKRRITGSLVLLGVFFLGFKTADDFFEISKSMDIFGKAYTEVNTVYVDETNPTQLMRIGIEAMLGTLDPYTNYYSESQIDESKIRSTGQYSGIGAELGLRGNKILILELFEEGPADQAGLKVGDEILQIDEESIQGTAAAVGRANNLLLGEQGSAVSVRIQRPGQESAAVIQVSRGGTEFQPENVPYFEMVNARIGYVLLAGFMQDAGKEVADAVRNLKKEHPDMAGVILDLRGNLGGRLDEAVNVCNVFLPQNELITEMRGRTPDSRQTFRTLRPPVDELIPLAVLVDSMSASASEIVSGAIQDLDRGVIVGERSFGKGLVQNVRPLSYNTQMKITIARYFIPSGRCIQAIDYSHRNPDGSPGRIPDSLYKSFETRSGRVVFDGGGVLPDLLVPRSPLPPVMQALAEQGHIFDFATQYAANHPEIKGPRAFRVGDALYKDFLQFLAKRKFQFQTRSEKQLSDWEKALEKLAYQEGISDELLAFRQDLQAQKGQDLQTHKNAIAKALKRELINRYYYKQGILEAAFTDDPDILKAVEILEEPARYRQILEGR